ncbi:hypothetical protein [Umezawaea tangerina]|uniref:Uncharacterized protein n=1 Tax=Umezawaea tangerina TaxID=84725 RepID=A0A2T0SPI0_9PSEU|nr:hypothetical protein [Umezawaea tangerina]PRY35317.1 hypothetical protein CLV43_114235 [Umezawaea tangerina]
MPDKSTRGLALLGALAATFDLVHGAMDQWFQPGWAAVHKRRRGRGLVSLRTGQPIGSATAVDGDLVVTEDTLGRAGATLHVATYTAGQLAATVAVTRALGVRLPARALLTGAAVNAVTHWVLDRGHPVVTAAGWLGKTEYVTGCTVVRRAGTEPDAWGPGTAGFELDQTAHKLIGWAAAAITTVIAVRRETADRGSTT